MASAVVHNRKRAWVEIPVKDEWLSHYLFARYVDGARGDSGAYDCWGLVREVRHKIYGKRLLPSCGAIRKTMPREFTKAYEAEAASMEVCEPEPGAIAAVFTGRLMLHVGVVVELEGRLAVLDINEKSGARWQRIPAFEAPFSKVVYYRDSPSFPEPN
jgi:hypothetical protein